MLVSSFSATRTLERRFLVEMGGQERLRPRRVEIIQPAKRRVITVTNNTSRISLDAAEPYPNGYDYGATPVKVFTPRETFIGSMEGSTVRGDECRG